MFRALKKIGKLSGGRDPSKDVLNTLKNYRMDMSPHWNHSPKPKPWAPRPPSDIVSEAAESVDEWYDDLCRAGNTGEQAAEIIDNFKADMAKAEAWAADQAAASGSGAAKVEPVVNAAAGATFSNPSTLNSWTTQAAAQLASTPGASPEELANALIKAGVPSEAVETTVGAINLAISEAPQGWIGRPAFNAALGVISSSASSAGVAAFEAAKAAVDGATGPGLAWSLGPAGVPAAAADATAASMVEAIEAAKASGADPVIAAINVISKAASPASMDAPAAAEGASESAPGSALAATGFPLDTVSPAQGALDVVGAVYNFWQALPWVIMDVLNELEANATDPSDIESLETVLAIGAPPDFSSRLEFPPFPYEHGGNRVNGVPSLPTSVSPIPGPVTPGPEVPPGRPTPSSAPTGSDSGTNTDEDIPTTTLDGKVWCIFSGHNIVPCPSGTTPPAAFKTWEEDWATHPTQTLKPAPPGTGGYLYDGDEPHPH